MMQTDTVTVVVPSGSGRCRTATQWATSPWSTPPQHTCPPQPELQEGREFYIYIYTYVYNFIGLSDYWKERSPLRVFKCGFTSDMALVTRGQIWKNRERKWWDFSLLKARRTISEQSQGVAACISISVSFLVKRACGMCGAGMAMALKVIKLICSLVDLIEISQNFCIHEWMNFSFIVVYI